MRISGIAALFGINRMMIRKMSLWKMLLRPYRAEKVRERIILDFAPKLETLIWDVDLGSIWDFRFVVECT